MPPADLTAEVTRDGFSYWLGRFTTEWPSDVTRTDVAELKRMFLPSLSDEGRKVINRDRGFVKGQLQHYGVQYDPRDYTGNGVNLMKKVLLAGKVSSPDHFRSADALQCDKVPEHLERLRKEMQAEWLGRVPGEYLASHPELLLKKYGFIDDDGAPNHSNTEVVGVPFPSDSDYRTSKFRGAANRIPGLHHSTYHGHEQMIFVGWDKVRVAAACSNRRGEEEREVQAAEQAREKRRSDQHERYLKNRDPYEVQTVVGKYIVDCKEIEDEWPDLTRNITLSIRPTSTKDLFTDVHKADIDFGMFEGVMMLSGDADSLTPYVGGDDQDSDEDDSDADDSEADGAGAQAGRKRKAAKPAPPPKPPKRPNAVKPRIFHTCMRGRETGEGEISPNPTHGLLTSDHPSYRSFHGQITVPYAGDVQFIARKVSDTPGKSFGKWGDFSWDAYDRACARRWM